MDLSKHEQQQYFEQLKILAKQLDQKELLEQHIKQRILKIVLGKQMQNIKKRQINYEDIRQFKIKQESQKSPKFNFCNNFGDTQPFLTDLQNIDIRIQQKQFILFSKQRKSSQSAVQNKLMSKNKSTKAIKYKIQCGQKNSIRQNSWKNNCIGKQNQYPSQFSNKKIQKGRSYEKKSIKPKQTINKLIKSNKKASPQRKFILNWKGNQLTEINKNASKSLLNTIKRPLFQLFKSQKKQVHENNKSLIKSESKKEHFRQKIGKNYNDFKQANKIQKQIVKQMNIFENIELPYRKQVSVLVDYNQQKQQTIGIPQNLSEGESNLQQVFKNYFQNYQYQKQQPEHQKTQYQKRYGQLFVVFKDMKSKINSKLNQKICLQEHTKQIKQQIINQKRYIEKITQKISKLKNQLDNHQICGLQLKYKRPSTQKVFQNQQKSLKKSKIKLKQNQKAIQITSKAIFEQSYLIQMFQKVILQIKNSLKQQQYNQHKVRKLLQFAKKMLQTKKIKQFHQYSRSQSYKNKISLVFDQWH